MNEILIEYEGYYFNPYKVNFISRIRWDYHPYFIVSVDGQEMKIKKIFTDEIENVGSLELEINKIRNDFILKLKSYGVIKE